MCGIIGIIAKEAVAEGLLEGLRPPEYRGYDSAGIATLVDGHIECRRAEGFAIIKAPMSTSRASWQRALR